MSWLRVVVFTNEKRNQLVAVFFVLKLNFIFFFLNLEYKFIGILPQFLSTLSRCF